MGPSRHRWAELPTLELMTQFEFYLRRREDPNTSQALQDAAHRYIEEIGRELLRRGDLVAAATELAITVYSGHEI